MVHHLLQVVGVNGVQNVEEIILSRCTLSFRVLIWKVLHHLSILQEHRVHGLNTELVIVCDLDMLHISLFQKLFPAREDVLEMVFVDDRLIRQIELETVKVKHK